MCNLMANYYKLYKKIKRRNISLHAIMSRVSGRVVDMGRNLTASRQRHK